MSFSLYMRVPRKLLFNHIPIVALNYPVSKSFLQFRSTSRNFTNDPKMPKLCADIDEQQQQQQPLPVVAETSPPRALNNVTPKRLNQLRFEILQAKLQKTVNEVKAAKAQAEVQAKFTEVQAKAAKAQAEAQAKFTEVQAKTAEALAKAAEFEAQAEAQAKFTEVQAKMAEALAKAAEFEAQAKRENFWLAFVVISGVGLVLDYILHESDWYIHWSIKDRLQEKKHYSSPKSWLAELAFQFPVQFLPVVMMGPTGSGKTTALQQYAEKESEKGRPVFYFAMRLQENGDSQVQDVHQVAKHLLQAMGYPMRRALIFNLSWDNFKYSSDQLITDRVNEAIESLFTVCAELSEQAADMGTVPLVIFDEVQDLVRNDRLAGQGGVDIFHTISSFALHYGVNVQRTMIFLVGSSSLFIDDLFKHAPVLVPRCLPLAWKPPPTELLEQRLHSLGYSLREMEKLKLAYGFRLRRLHPFLSQKKIDIDDHIRQDIGQTVTSFALLYSLLKNNAVACKQFVKVMDTLTFGEAQSVPPNALPLELHTPNITSSVFYKDSYGNFRLQEELVKVAWTTSRDLYSPSVVWRKEYAECKNQYKQWLTPTNTKLKQ